jgi:hypothetical protein
MAYSKLHSSIVHSSLWTEPDHIRILFITLLAIADSEGYVFGSRNGLIRLANLDPDDCAQTDPFQALLDPDKDSSDLLRNPENEGRRIEAVPGGFRILNFLHYRGLRHDGDRRDTNREAQRRHRERVSQGQPASAKVSQGQPQSAKVSHSQPISEAEAEADTERVNTSSGNTLPVNKSGKAPYSRSNERLLIGSLEAILHTGEMESNGAIWRMRIRSGKKERKALRNAIEDFSARTPDQQAKIHNRAAWLTDRYERCLKEIAC